MGKSEILMLLAGVALSIMLAMVTIPIFSSGSDMADRQQVQQELLAIKSSIPLIKGMEGDGAGTITAKNIAKHIKGFTEHSSEANTLKGEFLETEAKYGIADGATTVTVTVTTNGTKVDLTKFARLNTICDGAAAPTPSATTLTCVMKR